MRSGFPRASVPAGRTLKLRASRAPAEARASRPAPIPPTLTGAPSPATAIGPMARSSTPAGGAPEDLARYAADERARWAEVVRGAGIKLD
jgi:hypothetical protein